MTIKTFSQAKQFLYSHLPKKINKKFPDQLGLDRTKHLLYLLGNPQEKIKVIHIAGTSGKGSTAYLTSLLLTKGGYKTGLFLSPHLIDIRERFQINNSLVSKKKLIKYLNQIIPSIEKVKKTKFDSPTYFEILTAVAFLIFYQEKVNYAVVETGLGGTYDASNCINRKDKIALITKIGFDHTQILGEDLKEIASNKAGIINQGNIVFSARQHKTIQNILKTKTDQKKGRFFYLHQIFRFTNLQLNSKQTSFVFQFQKQKPLKISLSLVGKHQAENCSLALSAIMYLLQRDGLKIKLKTIQTILKTASFPGRFQILSFRNKTLIIDGAHNPQKIKAFIESLKTIYPNHRFNFLLAFKKKKDYKKMLKYIIPLAENVFLTKFKTKKQDLLPKSIEPKIIRSYLIKQGFKNCQIIKNSQQTLPKLLDRSKKTLVITGSLYLVGEIITQY